MSEIKSNKDFEGRTSSQAHFSNITWSGTFRVTEEAHTRATIAEMWAMVAKYSHHESTDIDAVMVISHEYLAMLATPLMNWQHQNETRAQNSF